MEKSIEAIQSEFYEAANKFTIAIDASTKSMEEFGKVYLKLQEDLREQQERRFVRRVLKLDKN